MSPMNLDRRELFQAAGLATAASLLPGRATGAPQDDPESLGSLPTYEWKQPDRPITAIVIGAGGRGGTYASYAPGHRDEWRIVGIAEPIEHRNQRMGDQHRIPHANRFATWQHVFDRPKFADVCVITTPDHLHYEPAIAALDAGYDLLLEKAIAPTWEQCNGILERAQANERIVGIGHVLRYAPFFRQMKHVVQSKRIGDVVSVQHLEPVQHLHMSHSFVRGNWRNTEESSPMLLSKSCHDLDILRWIVDKPCRQVQSFGSRSFFRESRAPEGATERCTGGCAAESTCIYSALRIYLRDRVWGTHHLAIPDSSEASIRRALEQGPYGKCVFKNDNDVVDHQIVNMLFDDEVTVSMSMEAMTSYGGRRTRIFCTGGDLIGDERTLEISDFASGEKIVWDVAEHATALGGHGGGDHRLVRDLVQAVSRRDPSLLTSSLDTSMESHQIGFLAEESRHAGGKTMDVG